MTIVRPIRYTARPEQWHAFAGLLGLTPAPSIAKPPAAALSAQPCPSRPGPPEPTDPTP